MKTEVATLAAPAALPEREVIQAGPGAPRLHIELTRPADLKLYEVTGEITVNSFGTGPGSGSIPQARTPRLDPRDDVAAALGERTRS